MMLSKSTVVSVAILAATLAPAMAGPVAPASAPQLRLAMSALGNLAPYRSIAADTLRIVQTGALPAAKVRVKDLETAWDDAEAVTKPKDRTTWSAIDKSIDAALNALRADAPKQADCTATLQALIAKMDAVEKA